MAKTVAEIQEWLNNPNHIKCILADINYYNGTVEKTINLSTRSYFDTALGVNTEYLAIITGGLSFSESLSTDLRISISYGTLEIENTGGVYDYLLDYIWKRREIVLYIGDASWRKSDFVIIFSGLVDNLVSSGESQLQLTIVDKLESLNETIATRTVKDLTGYSIQSTQEEKILPLLFGEVFNLSPIFVDTGINFDPGPWTAIIKNINSTSSIQVGQTITATNGIGQLYGGTVISCTVLRIIDINTIMYSVTATSRPIPGSITNLIINASPISAISSKTLLIDQVKGTGGPVYKVSDSGLNELVEARDKGAPIDILNNRVASYGEFQLKYSSFGTITCTARSTASSDCNVPAIITNILLNYGTNKLTSTDLDLANIDSSRAAYKVGIYVTERANILDICNELAKSINCGLYYSLFTINSGIVSKGKLKLVELKAPTTTVNAVELNDSLMLENTLQVSESFTLKPSIKLAYCKNYTQQKEDLALGLNPEVGEIYKDQYWYVEAKDQTLINLYKDSGIVEEEITHLLVTSEAQSEANKRLDLWKTSRQLITATYLPDLLFLQLGESVTIKSNRFNLINGKPGIVYSINRDWLTGFVEVGVLV